MKWAKSVPGMSGLVIFSRKDGLSSNDFYAIFPEKGIDIPIKEVYTKVELNDDY